MPEWLQARGTAAADQAAGFSEMQVTNNYLGTTGELRQRIWQGEGKADDMQSSNTQACRHGKTIGAAVHQEACKTGRGADSPSSKAGRQRGDG